MIDDFKNSFLNEIEKRFKNPFMWAFALSWFFWNWDFIYIVLFLEQQYVSIIPEVWETITIFTTKFEYIKNQNTINLWKSFIHPLWTSLLVIIFIEWGTTFLNNIIKIVKNKIEWRNLLSQEESEEIREQLVKNKINNSKEKALNNEEYLSLQSQIENYNLRFDDEVNERLDVHQEKNLKRIKELKNNLNDSEKISNERLEKNNFFEENIDNLKSTLERFKNDKSIIEKKYKWLNNEYSDLSKFNNNLKSENKELKENIKKLDKPLDEKYKIEYDDFKNTYFFKNFGSLIDEIENSNYDIKNKFLWKDIKYLKVKWIIETEEEEDNYWVHIKTTFTFKWDKFVEFFLDEYDWWDKNNDDISIEDIQF